MESVKINDECFPKYLRCDWEYHSTEEGRSYYVCWRCGEVRFDFEDTRAGG